MIRAATPHGRDRTRVYVDTVRTSIGTGEDLVDLIAVERALNGEDVDLTAREREVAAELLFERGYYPREVARRTGASRRTVQRRHVARQAREAAARAGGARG
jgi:hypothetical protein